VLKDKFNPIITYQLNEKESLQFYGDTINTRHDFFIHANCKLNEIELLYFFDSRGISNSYNQSLIKHIVDFLGDRTKYLIIGRPLEITTWVSLYNFIRLNNIHCSKIITNMGFVDFTPKKQSIIDKSVMQYNCYFDESLAHVNFLEKFSPESGDVLDLYMHTYSTSMKKNLENFLSPYSVIIINTPLVNRNYIPPRVRPASFLKGIELANTFNESLNINAQIVNFKNFSSKETYDGVHYTEKGNQIIFNKLSKLL
jgi:hypothetical protein